MKTKATYKYECPLLKPDCRLVWTLAAAAVLKLAMPHAVAAGFLGLGAPYSEKYDFTKVMSALEANRTEQTEVRKRGSVAIVVTSASGATVKAQKQGTGTWAYLFLTQFEGARAAVKTVTSAALRGRGLEIEPQSPIKLCIILDRFTVEKPHVKTHGFGPFSSEERNFSRFAFIEGQIQVLREGNTVYERKLAVQASREFGEKTAKIGEMSGLAGTLSGNKEENEGSRVLLVDLLQKYQNLLAADEQLLRALDGEDQAPVTSVKAEADGTR